MYAVLRVCLFSWQVGGPKGWKKTLPLFCSAQSSIFSAAQVGGVNSSHYGRLTIFFILKILQVTSEIISLVNPLAPICLHSLDYQNSSIVHTITVILMQRKVFIIEMQHFTTVMCWIWVQSQYEKLQNQLIQVDWVNDRGVTVCQRPCVI